jgi:hypothetical protein
MKFIPTFCIVLLSTSASARDITFGEIEAFISMGMEIRLPECKLDHCERHTPPSSISPEDFMKTDTIDFAGQRIRGLPEWLFEIKGLKTLRLTNSVLPWNDFWRLGELKNIEVLVLENVEIIEDLDANLLGVVNSQEDEDISRSDVFSFIFSKMENLAHLNLSNLRVNDSPGGFGGNKSEILANSIFTDKTARRLIDVNVNFSSFSGIFPYYTFDSLVTLAGPGNMKLDIAYEDAFSVPRLQKIDGFTNGSGATYVRGRIESKKIFVLKNLLKTDTNAAASFIKNELHASGLVDGLSIFVEDGDIAITVEHNSIFEKNEYQITPELRSLFANLGFIMKAYSGDELIIETNTGEMVSHAESVSRGLRSANNIANMAMNSIHGLRTTTMSHGDKFAVHDLRKTGSTNYHESLTYAFKLKGAGEADI